jgi:hypothetical protein
MSKTLNSDKIFMERCPLLLAGGHVEHYHVREIFAHHSAVQMGIQYSRAVKEVEVIAT